MNSPTAVLRISLEDRHLQLVPKGYGGKQAWLYEKAGLKKAVANRACGIAALANVSLYLSRTREACRNLYPEEVADADTFTAVMMEILKYLHPTPAGIFSPGMLSAGFRNYAKAQGVLLCENRFTGKWKKPLVEEYIKNGLLDQSPILLLTWNSRIQDLHNHWLIVSGIQSFETGESTIITSNWGYKREYSLDEWVDQRSLFRGLIYFT